MYHSYSEDFTYNSNTALINSMKQMFDTFISKLQTANTSAHRNDELEVRDRAVLMNLPPPDSEGHLPNAVLTDWTAQMCNQVFSSAFNYYSRAEMDYDHTKVFCSESILKNVFRLAHRYGLSEEQVKLIDNHIATKVAPYIKLKYPMTKSEGVNKALNDAIKHIDDREAIANDLLLNCEEVNFTYDSEYNQ